jgi:cyclopropane-fatty-acyl-phospholipid synthase
MSSTQRVQASDSFPVRRGLPNVALPGRPLAIERWLVRQLLRALGDPPIAVRLWTGEEISSATEPAVHVHVHERSTLFRLLYDPELEFGETYTNGRITVDGDLVKLLEAVLPPSPHPLARLLRRTAPPRSNTLRGSRENIHRHYDLGNDFYRLWLDERMVYTCAYFPTPEATLEEAQLAKMDHVCRKVRLRPGERVVEAGCGWGALALHMARHYGVNVRAFNISHEQILWAREKAKEEGLEERVEFVEDDYRNISGTYDVFMSVGMLEHVGRENYRTLGRVIDRCLTPAGRGLIHTIGRDRPARMNAWMERHIFPGAYTPALREMMEIFETAHCSVLDVENLRLHYAKTGEHWLARYERAANTVRQMFDERFVRAWRLYLSSVVAAFRVSSMQLFQVTFARSRTNDIPWTRAHVYGG